MKLKLYIVSFWMMLFVLPLIVAGQGVIISPGIYMKMSGGTLVLHGNWVNNGNWADTTCKIILNDTLQQHIGGSSKTEFDDLTINNAKGVIGSHDFTVAGILKLESANASGTVGTLDMGANALTMDSSATTVGMGDVTGIVKRTNFAVYKAYSFGNQFTTLSFSPGGTFPSQIQLKISIGSSPSWKDTAIKRVYDLIQTGGNNCIAAVSTHYLHTELNGNNENELVQWINGTPGPPAGVNEFGRSNYSTTENWVAISNVDIGNFPSAFGQLENTLSRSELASYTWNGSQSTAWTIIENWTPNGSPSAISNIIIPDVSTTTYSPTLPATAEIKTLTIQADGLLNSGTDAQLTIGGSSGAWSDAGTFNCSTSKVIFIDASATISGTTNFYDVTINPGASLLLTSGNITRIAGAMTNNGVWHTVIGGPTTVEYNGGNQTVVVPNPATNRYSTLILSGSGAKTLPGTAMAVLGDFAMAGTATATAMAALNTAGDFTLGSGATFNTGTLNHSVGGNFSNNGTFSAAGSNITCNGTTAQTIGGTSATTFNDLTIDNAANVTLTSDALTTVSGTLLVNSGKRFRVAPGKQLTAGGTITNNAGNAGFTLQSNAAGTASLLHNASNVSATMQRYISGAKEAWHFISSPVAAQGISGNWLPSGTYGNGTGYDLYLWNEPNSCWIYKLNTTSTINWNTVHPGSSFTPGRGYLYSVQANHPTKSFAGKLNNGSLTYPLTISSADVSLKGFNLVGNPYPSAIDWLASSGWTRSNLVSSGGGYDMWIWNPAANNYGVCNSATGICTNSVTRYIPSMQGFFVQAASAEDIGIDNAVRLHDAGTWFKSSEINPFSFSVVAVSEADSSFDEAGLLFGYTKNEPGARKLFSNVSTAPSLYLITSGENYSVRYLTDTTENPKVPLMFKPGRDGNYALRCNFDKREFETVMLEDRQMHYNQDLKTQNTYNYIASKTDDENRFVLHFAADKYAHADELSAGIYFDGVQLVIDMAKVRNASEVFIYDALGQLLVHETLQGLMQHKLHLNVQSQILMVQLRNQQGNLSRKLFYDNKNK